MKIKNPFRTRLRISTFALSPALGLKSYVVEYRKWWQLRWHIHLGDVYYGHRCPMFFDTKEEAIESVTAIYLN